MNLGDNETLVNLPVINIGTTVMSISTGGQQTCAHLSNGETRCWGSNSFGELGQGHTTTLGDNELPVNIPGISLGEQVFKIGGGNSNGHLCAVLINGSLRCWGAGGAGQLGLGLLIEKLGDNELPTAVPPIQLE